MPNPILEQIKNSQPQTPQQNSNIAALKNMMNLVRNSSNPTATLQMLAQTNPNIQKALEIAKSSGDLKNVFMTMAHQQGVDPNEILQALR